MNMECEEQHMTPQELRQLLERQTKLLYDILGLVNLLATTQLGGKEGDRPR